MAKAKLTKTSYIAWCVVLILVNILTLPYAWHLLKVIFASGNIIQQLEIFKWAAVGFVIFAIIRRYLKGNLQLAETFSHEFTHLVVAGIVNRELHEIHVKRNSGVVWTAGKNETMRVSVSLAPYCLPIFTFMLLSFRWMLDFHGMWLFDILVGITLCFHYYCFKTQIGNHQDDINQHPLIFSYFFIVTSWLVMFCILVPSFFPNMNGHGNVEPMYHYGIFSAIWRMIEAWWTNLTSIFYLHI